MFLPKVSGLNMFCAFSSAESLSRRNVRAPLQGVSHQRPRPQHLRPGALGEDSQHLHAHPGLLAAFQTCVWPADGLTVAHQPAADRAHPCQRSQQEPGDSCEPLLPESFPKCSHTGVSSGCNSAASTSECVSAKSLWMCGAENIQGALSKCFQRAEDSEKHSVQEEDINKQVPHLRMT